MMKNIIYKIFTVALAISLVSCGEFGDLNVNTNAPVKVGTETLLTQAMKSVSSVVSGIDPVLYVQHISEITYTEGSRYQSVIADFNTWYIGPLQDLQEIITLNTNEETKNQVLSGGSNANQIAVATILQSYFYQHMVDRWGPIPFTQALKGTEILLPAYDSPVDIYNTLFTNLKTAASQLESGTINGDIILGGNTDEWKKFANTLRMQMAIRIADVNPTKAQAEYNDAVAGGIFDKTINYTYLSETNNQNPWFGRFLTRTDFAISDVLFDYLTATNDARLEAFADTTASGEIVPMPYGLESSTVQPSDVSYPNTEFIKSQNSPIAIFSLAQIKFMQAEAAARGWGGNAAVLYAEAITASFNQYGITDQAAIDAFIAQPSVAYDAANWRKSIGEQKWVALFNTGYEGWNEWRRLDYPVLEVSEAPLNPSGEIPTRFIYPDSETTLNKANYDAAVQMLGGDDIDNVKIFWDVN